jgi:DNA repair protein RecN (Recombination protein N)
LLKELCIKNFALIDKLSICFDPYLNILTGETGAGKTILINALNLVLGGRASADCIRSGEDSAEVEAAFTLDKGHPVYSHLESAGYSCLPDEDLIVRRIIFRSEKANRCYLNGHMVPLSLLITIGAWLIDIHGQHEHQILLNPIRHLEILDRFGGLEKEVNQTALAFQGYQEARKKGDDLIKSREESKRDRELLAFQRDEIDSVNLSPGEEDELLKNRNLLAHAAKVRELTNSMVSDLYQADRSVSEILGDTAAKLHRLSSLDLYFKSMEENMNSIVIQIEDIAHQLTEYESKQDFSPEHLEQIEERLDLINRLKKKYQLTFEGILQFRKEIENRWQLIEDYEGQISTAFNEMNERWINLSRQASQLSAKRRCVAIRIEKEVAAQLNDLEMDQARFLAAFSDTPVIEKGPPKNMTPRGWDEVEFLFSANIGEEPRQLARIASGGEISRIMLAFKSCLAEADQVLTLVFDEIDTGIGGKAAAIVGLKIKQLATKRQIICITHLPQIASQATSHFLVSKKIEKERTLTVVDRLSRTEQIKELAKMIAGDSQSEIAIQHATEILERSGKR